MRTTTTLATLLLAAVAGCDSGSPTAAGPDDLGRQIVEALAQVPVEQATFPYIAAWRTPQYHRPSGPLNLSEVAIRFGSWNRIGDRELEEAVGEYAEREFPGVLKECPELESCRPLSPEDLPPEGLLVFWRSPDNLSNWVSASHYVFVRRGDKMVLDRPAWYSVEMERLEGGGWKVGKTMWRCCV